MLDLKSRRKLRAELQHPQPQKEKEGDLVNKNLLKRLSFSFYGQETIKKNKQVICENYDLTDQLPEIISYQTRNSISRPVTRENSLRNSKQKKQSMKLKIDHLFQDQKYDYDIVTTNASQFEGKARDKTAALKKSSRPSSVKVKFHKPEEKIIKYTKNGVNNALTCRSKTPKNIHRKAQGCAVKKK